MDDSILAPISTWLYELGKVMKRPFQSLTNSAMRALIARALFARVQAWRPCREGTLIVNTFSHSALLVLDGFLGWLVAPACQRLVGLATWLIDMKSPLECNNVICMCF